MDKLESMKVFIEVAESHSFVEASRRLGLSPPAVTRSIAHLEKHLGIRLFTRTTRHVRLTDAGTRFFNDSKRILEEIEEAEAAASGSYLEPKGVLRVTAPTLFGQKYITQIITEYLAINSEVSVKALFYDRVANVIEEGIDVAIRIGHLKDSSLYAIPVGSVKRVVCASPDYLETFGIPDTPADLATHQIVLASGVDPSTSWRFKGNKGKESIKIFPRLECNQNGVAVEATVLGHGISRLMSYQVAADIEKGSLIRILPNYESEPYPIHLIHSEGHRANAKIRSFIDLAVERLRANTFINPPETVLNI